LQPRSHDRLTAFGDGPTARWHSRATLSLRPDLTHDSFGVMPEPRRTFHSPYPERISSLTVHFELDPRSLDPAALFGARMPSLFEVRRRLVTSATAISTCGQPNLGPLFLAGTMASTIFLFLRTTPLFRAVMRGEPHSVRFGDPGAGSSRLREFAQPRCLQQRPTTAVLP